jgi:hypothetical protein
MNDRRPRAFPFALALMSALAACDGSQGTYGRSCADMVDMVKSLSPAGEARSKMRDGDRRFLAVHNLGMSYPGVDARLVRVHGYREMRRTSDIESGPDCDVYSLESRRFAEAYNREIVRLSRARSR